jgi:hypothetical protein
MEPHREKGLAALYIVLGVPLLLFGVLFLLSSLGSMMKTEMVEQGRAYMAGYLIGIVFASSLFIVGGILLLRAANRRLISARTNLEKARNAEDPERV